MTFDFTGKRALITGAGKGIGRDLTQLLHEAGAEVIALSRTQEDLDSLKAELDCHTIRADLASAEDAKRAAEAAGDIDLLVNNAGVALLEPFLETTVDAFERTMSINVRAVMIVSQVIAKAMIARGTSGAIVNVSSQASSIGLWDHTSYCTSKGALDQLTRVMALELAQHNIRVSAVNPTVTLTPMAELAWGDPAKRDPMLAKIPMGRFAQPREVSEAIAYLLSDAASMITGVTLPVDGGFSAS